VQPFSPIELDGNLGIGIVAGHLGTGRHFFATLLTT
jgi:hypothetical protein